MTPRDPGYRQREENPHQGPSHSFGKPSEPEQAERERSIETGREKTRQTPSVGRPQAISSLAGFSASPFSMLRRMADDMDRVFQDFGLSRVAWTPQLEAFRRGDKLVIRADLPGLKKEDVKVEVKDGVLTLSGERRFEREEDQDDMYRSERAYGRFYRAISLPDNVNPDDCDASFKDGVLEIAIGATKQTEPTAKQVRIR